VQTQEDCTEDDTHTQGPGWGDSGPLFLSAIRKLSGVLKTCLAHNQGCKVVGAAGEGDEALLMIRTLLPDVVLLDVSMPVKGGLEVLRELRDENSEVIVIMFTADSTPLLKQTCLAASANYFVSKTEFRQVVDIFAEIRRS